MSKRTEKVDKTLSEAALMRSANKKQQEKLYKTVKAAGGDIGMRVRAGEKNKEDKMPNAIYMDNPWGSKRNIQTYEDFQMKEEDHVDEAGLPTAKGAKQMKNFMKKATKGKKKGKKEKGTKDLASGAVVSTYEAFLPKHLEDMYFWRTKDKISLNDDNWVRGTKEDFERPMFKNLPNHKDRHPYDVLRSGKWIETKDGKVVGQIDTMRGNMITLDVIDEDNKHQYVDFEIIKLIKKIKDNELKINSNTTSKNKKVNMPWGKITMKQND